MSLLSRWLQKAGVPQAGLDAMQGMLEGLTGDAKKRINEIVGKMKSELGAVLPNPDALATSIRGQAQFKAAYRALTPEQQVGVDKALETICAAALVKMRKSLGI